MIAVESSLVERERENQLVCDSGLGNLHKFPQLVWEIELETSCLAASCCSHGKPIEFGVEALVFMVVG